MAGGTGTLASRVVKGPLRKEKSFFIASAKRSYADVSLKAFGQDNIVYFYDVNAKVKWRHNNNNRFFLRSSMPGAMILSLTIILA